MVSVFFTWFTGPFLVFLAVSRFGRSAPTPVSRWEIVGLVAVIVAFAFVAVALDAGWYVPLGAGAAGLGAFTGRWLGIALRKPSPD